MSVLIVNPLEWPFAFGTTLPTIDTVLLVAYAMGLHGPEYEGWRIQTQPKPPVQDPRAVIIAGSLASAYDSDAWITQLTRYIHEWVEKDIPMLGVCFGHQLIAQALGGTVQPNPKGWELGRVPIYLTEKGTEDYLFKGCPDVFHAMQTHQDAVVELPPQAECLALSDLCGIQSFRIGEKIRTIQFHPEFNTLIMNEILSFFRDMFEEMNFDLDRISHEIQPCPESYAPFINFRNQWGFNLQT
jgi:GMP synthase (glutamine-hydrolysing)